MNINHAKDREGTKDAPTGVLIMAYGTPANPEQVEAYYTHIRRGHKPTPELLEELQQRYQAIGGLSPLTQRTQEQVTGIQQALDELAPGRFRTRSGMKHATPFIEESAQALLESGVSQIIGLVLAPHYSTMSVAEYHRRAQNVISQEVPYKAINNWHLTPGYLDYLTEQVKEGKERLLHENNIPEEQLEVVFTAHSLPQRILERGDPYPQQLQETAQAVAQAARLQRWSIGWQSAGRTADPWIGPDILQILQQFAEQGQTKGVLVCAAGFVSDHLEVLYDLDIEARQLAHSLGIAFTRTAMPNANPLFVKMLAEVVYTQAY